MKSIFSHKRLGLAGISLALVLALGAQGFAGDATADKSYGVAIEGYDPVAYFTDGKAVPGNPAYHYNWNEATWYFTSEKHRAMFAESPQKYAPSHAGLCALSMVVGSLIEPDPRVWKIVNGKLHLGWDSVYTGQFASE
jgi:YHS domain-containing protein